MMYTGTVGSKTATVCLLLLLLLLTHIVAWVLTVENCTSSASSRYLGTRAVFHDRT